MPDDVPQPIPFNPAGSVARIRVFGPAVIEYPLTASQQILTADPRRLWALITWEGPSTGIRVAPYQFTTSGGVGETGQQGYILLHNASLPGLVQSAWHSFCSAGQILYVWQGQLYEG